MVVDEVVKKILKKRGYKLVGEHSAVKLCHWLRERLLRKRPCYKSEFYGIDSHRCMQITPTVDHCNHHCLFCWRHHSSSGIKPEEILGPDEIVEGCIEKQRILVTGFKGDNRCDLEEWNEARNPKHVAISLAGEPTLYPKLGELIEACHRRGMTTFLVTNGTMPKVLMELDPLPTQLYVTIAAPNKEIYKKLCIPTFPKGWELLNETLEILPSLGTRTTIRHTLVQDWNLGYTDDYIKLDRKADTLFVEPKAYMFVGESRMKMKITNMPSHESIKEFSKKLNEGLGYDLVGERPDSRVVLLTKDRKKLKIDKKT
jgi:tRNA wybutosine-synthesizing protein 1